jgi:ATP-dependent phosphoenolpyruvate carboxykinase
MSESRDASGVDQVTSGNEDKVQYETYKKVLSEKKASQAKLDLALSELEQLKSDKLNLEGNKDKIIEELSGRVKKAEDGWKQSSKAFANKVFEKEARAVALQLGADPLFVDDLIAVGRTQKAFDAVEIKDDFTVDEASLKDVFARMQREKPIFFKAQAKATKDVHLAHGGAKSIGGVDLSKASKDDILDMWSKLK